MSSESSTPSSVRRLRVHFMLSALALSVSVMVSASLSVADAVGSSQVPRLTRAPKPLGRDLGRPPKDRPNILLFLLDDADVELLSEPLLSHFPTLKALYSESVVFRNAFVTTPLCGPSRAAIQRGQYGHRIGVLTNEEAQTGLATEPSGGFNIFYQQGLALDTLATRLDDVGYRTMLVGKYLHESFPGDAGDGYVPPGWDELYASRGGRYFQTNRYINGVGSTVAPGLYRTDVERDDALGLLQDTPDVPWFLFMAPYAVHKQFGADPMFAARHETLFSYEALPKSPDYLAPDEWGLYKTIEKSGLNLINGYHRDRMRAMLGFDEMVAAILTMIESRGERDRTVIILTSDNGILLGHHRHFGKSIPYDRALRVPLWIQAPWTVPAETSRLATTADLLPTIVDFARAEPADYTDGLSLKPVVREPELSGWRSELLAEGASWHYGGPGLQNAVDSRWTAVITETEKYVEFADGRWMYHDLLLDPYELNPSHIGLPDRDPWQRRLAILEQCSGDGCRHAAPETAIGTPIGSIRPLTGFSIDGFASAAEGNGVTEVRLVLRHVETGLYWNSTAWQTDLIQIQANLAQPGEGTSTWSYPFAGLLPEGDRLNVTARTYDDAGEYDLSVASVQVTVSAGPGGRPETTMVLPSYLSARTMRISGWVLDKSGVNRVDLMVNGNLVPTQLGPEPRREQVRTWTAEVTLVSGVNVITATGVDHHGMSDLTPATRTFTLP